MNHDLEHNYLDAHRWPLQAVAAEWQIYKSSYVTRRPKKRDRYTRWDINDIDAF